MQCPCSAVVATAAHLTTRVLFCLSNKCRKTERLAALWRCISANSSDLVILLRWSCNALVLFLIVPIIWSFCPFFLSLFFRFSFLGTHGLYNLHLLPFGHRPLVISLIVHACPSFSFVSVFLKLPQHNINFGFSKRLKSVLFFIKELASIHSLSPAYNGFHLFVSPYKVIIMF